MFYSQDPIDPLDPTLDEVRSLASPEAERLLSDIEANRLDAAGTVGVRVIEPEVNLLLQNVAFRSATERLIGLRVRDLEACGVNPDYDGPGLTYRDVAALLGTVIPILPTDLTVASSGVGVLAAASLMILTFGVATWVAASTAKTVYFDEPVDPAVTVVWSGVVYSIAVLMSVLGWISPPVGPSGLLGSFIWGLSSTVLTTVAFEWAGFIGKTRGKESLVAEGFPDGLNPSARNERLASFKVWTLRKQLRVLTRLEHGLRRDWEARKADPTLVRMLDEWEKVYFDIHT